MDQIEIMYQQFKVDEALKTNLEMLNTLTITNRDEYVCLNVETHIHEDSSDRLIEKEIINAKLV